MFSRSDRSYGPIPAEDDHDGSVGDGWGSLREEIVPINEGNDREHHAVWCFVESAWFQMITVAVIMANFILMMLKTKHPNLASFFRGPEYIIVLFFVFELHSKLCYHGSKFLFGPFHLVAWNVLDFVVAFAAVIDEFILPNLPNEEGPHWQGILKVFRCLRLIRLLKIVRFLLESDLAWCESSSFQSFIGVIIGLNSALLGMETDIPWDGWLVIEQVLLAIYVFELSASLKRHGWFFWSSNNADVIWNYLDVVIVITSSIDSWLLPIIQLIEGFLVTPGSASHSTDKQAGMSLSEVMMLMRMMRLMRILRLVKLVKSIRPLYILITSVLAALQGVAWVLVLTLVVLYAMGIASTRLIGQSMVFPVGAVIPRNVIEPFKSVPDSMFTLFRFMSGAESEDEAAAIDDLMVQLPLLKFAFVFFMITSSWTLLSILTAVVSENMISTTGQQEYEMQLASDE